jgi:hypothetical protein
MNPKSKLKYPSKISPMRKIHFTYGEFFNDGSSIELVRDPADAERLVFLHWNGNKILICSRVERDDGDYVPAILEPTMLRVLRFPAKSPHHDTSHELLEDISRILLQYSRLRKPFVTVVGYFVLATWLFGAIVAPWLSIVGPETAEGMNLFKILSCLCRHALSLTDIGLSAMCSLPMGLGLTLMLRSSELGPNVERALAITRKRDAYVLRNGHLHDLHCSLVTYSQFPGNRIEQGIIGLEVPIRPTHEELPVLDERAQQEIAATFQPRLLTYRFEKFTRACDSKFDTPQFTYATRELARCLGACTPGEELPEDLLRFLETYDTEIRSTKWVDLNVVILESLVGFCREGESQYKYVGDIAKEVCVIMERRGEERLVTGKDVGRRLRLMGFQIEPRDSKGFKVERTATFCRRVDYLAQESDVPFIQNETIKASSDKGSARNKVKKT